MEGEKLFFDPIQIVLPMSNMLVNFKDKWQVKKVTVNHMTAEV